MIEQFYPWYWKFYDMATDDSDGVSDDDADAQAEADYTGEDEAGEDAPPGEDAPSGGTDTPTGGDVEVDVEVNVELSYGEDEDKPNLRAPVKKQFIDVSKIAGNKILRGLEIKSSIGEELLNKISEGNIHSNGDRSKAIITGSPGARFWLNIVDIDDDTIVNLQNVQIGESGKYIYLINFPKSSTTNKYKINLRVGDGTRINPSLPRTDPMYTIHQRVNPTATFTKATGTATGVTYSGGDIAFKNAPYAKMNQPTNGRHSSTLANSTNNVNLYGDFAYTVTAAKGGAKVYVKKTDFNFTNSTVVNRIVTQKVNNSNTIYLNDVSNLYIGMELSFDDMTVTKNNNISSRRLRVSSTSSLLVGMTLVTAEVGRNVQITSIDNDSDITLSSSVLNINNKESIVFRRSQNNFTLTSVNTDLKTIILDDSINLEKGDLIKLKNNETKFYSTASVSNNGSASVTLTNNIKIISFGSKDVTFTLPTDDIFTLVPNAHDQHVEVVKQTATDINVLLKDTDDNKSGKTPSTVREPVHGKITGSYGAGDGIITYTPNVGFVGNDSFDFKVNDGTTDSEVKTIYITVHK